MNADAIAENLHFEQYADDVRALTRLVGHLIS